MYAAATRWSLDVFFSAMGGGQVVRMIRLEWLVIQAADILPMMYWRIAQLTRLLATCNVVDLRHRAKCCDPMRQGFIARATLARGLEILLIKY